MVIPKLCYITYSHIGALTLLHESASSTMLRINLSTTISSKEVSYQHSAAKKCIVISILLHRS